MIDILLFIKNYIIGFIALIAILVFVHEYGHYIVAKYFGVKIESFSIGFGKELIGWTDKSGTRWKIAPFPLGGYVKMKGEGISTSNYDSNNQDQDAFANKKLYQKFLIVFAGPLANLIFPLLILFIITFFFGITLIKPQIGDVLKDSPAINILKKDDIILSINDHPIEIWQDIQQQIFLLPDQKITITILRNEQKLTKHIKLSHIIQEGIKIGFIGISNNPNAVQVIKRSVSESIAYSVKIYVNTIDMMFVGLKRIFTGKMHSNEIGGPIKIAQITGDSLAHGLQSWLFLMAMLSINLAILNLLPIPALDGGHLLFFTIQAVLGKYFTLNIQNTLTKLGFIFLLSLMLLIIIKDIISFL